MNGLDRKVIIVTGAGGGIGSATAARLASEGASIVLADLHLAAAQEAANAITTAGGTAIATEVDIGDEDAVRAMVDLAVDEFGRLDGLHNNAADLSDDVLGRDGDLLEVPFEVWQRTIDVSLSGAFHCCRHALPHILASGGGAIVNTSSDAAFHAEPRFASYSVAKAGLLALTRHIAVRWGKERIRCNAITPGLVLTKGAQELVGADWIEHQLSINHSWRLGEPEDIAAVVALLMSDDGAWINGQTYSVNGGAVMR